LPEALRILIDRKQTQKVPEDGISWLVSRNRLLDSPDCSLSGDRYRAITARISGKWPSVKIADIASVLSGGTPSKSNGEFWSGSIPWVSPKDMKINHIYDTEDHVSEDAVRNSAVNLVPSRSILCVVRSGILAHSFPVALATRNLTFNQDINAIVIRDERVLSEYLFHLLKGIEKEVIQSGVKKGGTVHSLRSRFLHDLAIPLPPLAEQERIVAELEGYRKIIEGARQVIANYKPVFRIDPHWPRYTLSDLCSMEYGLTVSGKESGDARLVRITDITEAGQLSESEIRYVTLDDEARSYLLRRGGILVARTGATYGKTLLFDNPDPAVFASYLIRLRFSDKILPAYYWLFAQTDDYWGQARTLVSGGGQPQFNGNALRQVHVPVPPLEIQREIMDQADAERVAVESNRNLVGIFEARIKAKLEEIWGMSAEESGVRESPISQSEPAMDLSEPRGVGLADSSSSG
jgi:restriction endonuclease S subunit